MARKKPAPIDEPAHTIKFDDAKKAQVLADNAVQIAEVVAIALIAAESMGIKTKPLEHFSLSPAQREVLLTVPCLSKSIKSKLAMDKTSFTVAEVASMTMALAEALIEADPRTQISVFVVVNHLMERLQAGIAGPDKRSPKKAKEPKAKKSDLLFQFKITLLDIRPPIWRRIQIPDCTLADLHEYIQVTFGWLNSHLHQFEIDGERYSQPSPDGDDYELDFKDEAGILISKLLPKSGERTKWIYEYDFGDGWRHEVLFEGFPPKDPKVKYPLCLEGKRACPPEDCGGPWGYANFLDVIANPKHEEHAEMLEWSGPFDPEAFDAKKATREMRKVE